MRTRDELKKIAKELRKELIQKHASANMGHIGSDFSCIDILITLYLEVMNEKDSFILSKGHSALALYAVLHKKGILNDEMYNSLGKNGSLLGEHPLQGIPGVEAATGSLGHGLSIGGGIALANSLNGSQDKVFVLLSDGECQEGSTLEAMNFIGRTDLKNVVAIVDNNNWQAYDRPVISIKKVEEEFLTSGWAVIKINGHSYDEIYSALTSDSASPKLVIASTVLGKGVKEMEDKLDWHYLPPRGEQINLFIEQVE